MPAKKDSKRNSKRWLKGSGILLLAGMVLMAVRISADVVSGHHEFDFAGKASIWDISGSYSETLPLGGQTSFTITQDNKGKFTGTGSTSANGLDMNFDIKGAIKSKGAVTTIKMAMKFKGSGVVDGSDFKFSGSLRYVAEIDEANQRASGTIGGKIKLSVKGVGSETVQFPDESFDLDFEGGMDGSFIVAGDFQSNGNSIAGTGSIILSNDEQLFFSIKGKFKAKRDESKVALKGDTVKLKMALDGDGNILSLKGKVLGQKLAM